MGIGFAIPSNTVRPITERLVRTGLVGRGWLGVEGNDLTPEIAKAEKVAQGVGVVVTGIRADAPAAKAGIARGDVIEKVNGESVESNGKFKHLVASAGANAQLRLEISRRGKAMTVVVTLVEEPAPPDGRQRASAAKRESCG